MRRKIKKEFVFIVTTVLLLSTFIGSYIYGSYNTKGNLGEIISDNKNKYDAAVEIKAGLRLLSTNDKAEVIANVNSQPNVVALSFEGLSSDKATMEKIIDMLDKQGIKGTFFLPGIKAAEDTSIVKLIQKSGHDIGNGTLSGRKGMEKLSEEELVTDFTRTNKILKVITGEAPILLKSNSTVYNEEILAAAYASGNKYVVTSNHYLSYQSFKNYDQAYGYVNNLEKGRIISIKLEGVLDSFEYGEKEEKPAIDKEAGIEEKVDEGEEVTIIQIVEWILKAIDEQNKGVVKLIDLPNIPKENKLQESEKLANNQRNSQNVEKNTKGNIEGVYPIDAINFKELIKKNNKKLAPVISEFYTTQKSVAYTFRGLSNEESLNKVLETLEKLKSKGTFFVTKEEILKYPDRINKILSKGHEIGNGGITNSSSLLNKSVEEITKEIYEVDKLLRDKGILTNAYMAGYGYSNATIQEALSSIRGIPSLKNYELFTYTKAPISHKYKDMKSGDIVVSYFNVNSYVSLKKGEIVYFRLDSELFKDNALVGNIVEEVTKNYVQKGYAYKYNEKLKLYDLAQKPLEYSVVALSNLQKTVEVPQKLGRYNIIGNPISMKKRSYENAVEMMKTNYVGYKAVDLSSFSEEEKLYLDKTGNIDTKGESVIFFTFDDWGGDPVINEILDVLEKHKVKGSFFVVSKYTDINSGISNANPNLLRTIALRGHDVGSHNYNHELLNGNKKEMETSLIKSYKVMANIIGDLNSLKLYFRPPTLFVTREGLASVFESGYKYSISGNITTHDYESSTPQEIVSQLEEELVRGKGNVVIMHMNNQSYYTAEALDIFLTNNEKGIYGEKYKIAKLSDYLEK